MDPCTQYDLLGRAFRPWDRLVYCRCDGRDMRVAYVAKLEPLIVYEPDARRYTQLFDGRYAVIVDDFPMEREVRKALRGIGMARGE